MIEKFGYDTYMEDFGGNDMEMYPRRLFGWARHIASIEPDIGYPLLRSFNENIDETYVDRERYYGDVFFHLLKWDYDD